VEALLQGDESRGFVGSNKTHQAIVDAEKAGGGVEEALLLVRKMVCTQGRGGNTVMPSVRAMLGADQAIQTSLAEAAAMVEEDGTEVPANKMGMWGRKFGTLASSSNQWSGLFGVYDSFVHFCGTAAFKDINGEPRMNRTRLGKLYVALVESRRKQPLSQQQMQKCTSRAGVVYTKTCIKGEKGLSFGTFRLRVLPEIASTEKIPVETVEEAVCALGRPNLDATKWMDGWHRRLNKPTKDKARVKGAKVYKDISGPGSKAKPKALGKTPGQAAGASSGYTGPRDTYR